MNCWQRTQAIACHIIILAAASACQMLPGDNPAATIEYEMTRYVTEAAEIGSSSLAEQTRSAATIQAAATESGFYVDYNNLLLVTVRAGDMPTPELQVASGPQPLMVEGEATDEAGMSDGYGQAMTGEVSVSQVATAGGVRSSDGCASGSQSSFRSDDERIYFTFVASNLQAGTRFDVSWQYQGSTVHQTSWSASQNQVSLCIWFYIDPSDVPFTPGNWSAALSVNGSSAGTANFTISDE